MNWNRVEKKLRDLKVWRLATELCIEVFAICDKLGPADRYSLGDQLRRSALSIPSNISEGHAFGPSKTFHQHVKRARGSLSELQTQLLILESRYPELDLDQTWRKVLSARRKLEGLERWLMAHRNSA